MISTSSNSSQQISSTTGWVVFILGIIFATFVGGALRAFLAPAQLARWVEERLYQEDPKFSLQFEKIEFALAEGSWPRFGFKFYNMEVQAKDPCDTRSQMEIDSLYIPVKLSSLFSGKVRFSDIKIGSLQYYFRPPLCNQVSESEVFDDNLAVDEPPPMPVENEEPQKDVIEAKKDHFKPIQQFFSRRFAKELENSKYWFDSLEVEKILYHKESDDPWFAVENLSIDLQEFENEIRVTSQVRYLDHEYFRERIDAFGLELRVSKERARLITRGKFKEGDVSADLLLAFAEGDYDFKSSIKYLPIGEIIHSFQKMDLLSGTIKPRLLWFSCDARATGKIIKKEDLILKASNCDVYGEAGRIQAKDFQIMPFAEKKLIPFVVNVEKFSLRYFVELLGNEGVTGVLSDFGKISGKMSVTSHEELQFQGKIENIEALFSNRGKVRLQKVNKVSGEVELKGGRVSGLIDDFDINGGEYQGQLSFNLDDKFKTGLIVVTVDSLKFNDQINQLLMFGNSEPIQIYGQAQIEEGQFRAWRGNIGLAALQGSGWRIEGVKLDSELSEEKFSSKVTIANVKAEKGSYLHEVLNPLYLKNSGQDIIEFKDVSFLGELSKAGGSWSKLKASDSSNDVLLASSGIWNEKGRLKGWVNVDFPKAKLLRWDIKGTLQTPVLIPSPRLLKLLAGKNSTLKISENMSDSRRQEVLKRLLKSDTESLLRNLGEKVLDTAKKWLPQFEDTKKAPKVVNGDSVKSDSPEAKESQTNKVPKE